MVCNVVDYSVVVVLILSLLVVRKLVAAITGSCVGSPIDLVAIFGKIFLRGEKWMTIFPGGRKGTQST